MILRDYQVEAINRTAQALRLHKRVVLTAATGAGKSLIIAGIVQRFMEKNPGQRILILCHQAEILTQNKDKIEALGIRCSVYCASLGRKEPHGFVVLASRDSAATKNSVLLRTRFSLVLIDECHLVDNKKDTQYQKILEAVQPVYTIGFTGSPYRMSGGVIFGNKKFWEAETYRITVKDLQERGYLCPHIFPKLPAIIQTSQIKTTGGDFNLGELERTSSTPDIVRRCVSEWWRLARKRVCSIFFCVSHAHAEIVRNEIAQYTPQVALVTGETPTIARNRMLEDARNGKVKAICNIGVLTTGVDVPVIDCVVFLRATQSVSLMIQMSGRGLRIAPKKENCLFLDFTGNWQRFGGLDDPLIPTVGAGTKGPSAEYKALLASLGIQEDASPFEAPKKECPQCKERVPNGKRKCECGHIFINHGDQFDNEIQKLKAAGWDIGYAHFKFVTQKIGTHGTTVGVVSFEIKQRKFTTYFPFHTKNVGFNMHNRQVYRQLKKAYEEATPVLVAAKRKAGGFDEVRVIHVGDAKGRYIVRE